jgi:hypothetical protein
MPPPIIRAVRCEFQFVAVLGRIVRKQSCVQSASVLRRCDDEAKRSPSARGVELKIEARNAHLVLTRARARLRSRTSELAAAVTREQTPLSPARASGILVSES